MCWTKWELVLSHPDLQPFHTFIHRKTLHEETSCTGEVRCMRTHAWNNNLDPARKPIKRSGKHGDSPRRRPRACTVSRPGPCRCRAAGSCWPSPSCHTVPAWQPPSPPSAPWGPPGARAPGRSPGETSLLPLQKAEKHKQSGYIMRRYFRPAEDRWDPTHSRPGRDCNQRIKPVCTQGAWVNRNKGGEDFSFWNVCSLALELTDSCSTMYSTISPDVLSSVVLRGIHSLHITV